MASTRTPVSGTIKMSDLDKSISSSWSSPSQHSLQDLETKDFFDGVRSNQPIGFAYCYGTPGPATPHRLSDYYDILGWVDYRIKAINVQTFNAGGTISVDINPMNGSNGTAPGMQVLTEGVEIPTGDTFHTGAHWETLQFVVTVAGYAGGTFDVYFGGTYIDTISRDGIYVYDNGGLGYTNDPAVGGFVDISFQ